MPFYGDSNTLIDATASTNVMCTNDGKLYRIRNGQALNNNDYYLAYVGGTETGDNKLSTKYADDDDNVANQLWQIFYTPNNQALLYNVGSGMYLCPDGTYATVLRDDVAKAKRNAYNLVKDGDCYRIWRNDMSKCFGTDLGVKGKEGSLRVSTDKGTGDGDRSKWYLEPYTGSKSFNNQLEEVLFETVPFKQQAVSAVIPEGYRVGFMLRKLKGAGGSIKGYENITDFGHGCCYGDGRLNLQINQFPGHFDTSVITYSMKADDPRIAMFMANGKTYLTFEDGCDCNFSDMIIEVTSGIDKVEESFEIEAEAYTMCFEDRPNTADYDLNDVVLRCTRSDDGTELFLALVATGANDDVVIHGAEGWQYNNQEVHSIFRSTAADERGNRFINTVNGGKHRDIVGAWVPITPGVSIPQYLKGIYIENQTTGKTIRFSQTGEPPFAIIVPEDFDYPMEGQPITQAYKNFIDWAHDVNMSGDWYRFEEAGKIFPSLFKKW